MATRNARGRKNETQIRALLDDWANALRAKDAERVMSLYAADLVQFDLAPPLKQAGENAVDKKGLAKWFSSFQGPIGYEIRDLSITASDDLAFCHSLNRLSGRKAAGEEVDVWLRATACFRRIAQQWRITHWHESVPFYMDGSYRAAVDLKP
jgi:PhnB protein